MSKRYLTALALVCVAMFPLANAMAESSASCSPLSAAQNEIATAGGGKLAPISHEELQFARELFVASPPVSVMGLSPTVTKLLFALDKSI